jgi:hypothetical protein
MPIHKFASTDASMERSPGQDGDIFTGNLLDQRHGAGNHRLRALRAKPDLGGDQRCSRHHDDPRGKGHCFRRVGIGDGRSWGDHRHVGGR